MWLFIENEKNSSRSECTGNRFYTDLLCPFSFSASLPLSHLNLFISAFSVYSWLLFLFTNVGTTICVGFILRFVCFSLFFWLKQNGNRTQIRNSRMRGQSRCRKNCLYRMGSQSTVLVRLQIEMLQWSFASFWYLLYAVCSIFNSLRLK